MDPYRGVASISDRGSNFQRAQGNPLQNRKSNRIWPIIFEKAHFNKIKNIKKHFFPPGGNFHQGAQGGPPQKLERSRI